MNTLLHAAFWILVAVMVILLGIAIVMLGLLLPVLIVFLIPTAPIWLLVLGKVMTSLRRWRSNVAMCYLEQAVRLNLPLPAMLEAAARSEHGSLRIALAQLRSEIEAGTPMSLALHSTVPGLPHRAFAQLRASELIGKVAPTLRRLIRSETTRSRTGPPDPVLDWIYPITTVLVMLVLVSFVTIMVIPKFEDIFADFDVALPWMTVATFNWSSQGGPLMAFLALLGILVLLTWALVQIFVGTIQRPYPGQSVIDHLIWSIPMARRAVCDRALADACAVAADGTEAGLALNRVLLEASYVATNLVVSARIERWARAVEEGVPVAEAAQRARMPGTLVSMLSTAAETASLSDVLRYLARYYGARFSRAQVLVRNAMLPLMVILLAVIVAWIVVSLFLPLVVLIEATTLTVM